MTSKNFPRILIVGILLLFTFGLISVVIYSLKCPRFDTMICIAGFSTFVIALLTLIYVFTTWRQFEVMIKQLEEMQHSRILQDQPLPWIDKLKMFIMKPRLFFSPMDPAKPHNAHSRYKVEFTARNIGNSTAVCVDFSSRLTMLDNDNTSYLNSASVNVETLEEKQTYPLEKSLEHFLFCSDDKGKLLKSLRENDIEKYPRLFLRTYYRNTLGGCFVIENIYRLYPGDSKQDEILKNWLSRIVAFPIEYKNDLESLKFLENSDSKQYHNLFKKLKSKFAKSIVGKDIELHPWPIPGAFKVEVLSHENYSKALDEIYYGRLLAIEKPRKIRRKQRARRK